MLEQDQGPGETPFVGAVLVVLCVGLALASVWLLILTVSLHRLRCRYGEPVFQRLRNGRFRFTWGVPQALDRARRNQQLGIASDPHPSQPELVQVDVEPRHGGHQPGRRDPRFDHSPRRPNH